MCWWKICELEWRKFSVFTDPRITSVVGDAPLFVLKYHSWSEMTCFSCSRTTSPTIEILFKAMDHVITAGMNYFYFRNELRAACRKPPLWSAQSLSSLFRYLYTTKFEIFAKFWFIIHDWIMNKDLSRGLVRTYCMFGAQTWSRTCVCIAMIASLLKLLRTICTESSWV